MLSSDVLLFSHHPRKSCILSGTGHQTLPFTWFSHILYFAVEGYLCFGGLIFLRLWLLFELFIKYGDTLTSLNIMLSCSVLSNSSDHGIFPGKNTGVGCHFLIPALYAIYLTNNWNQYLVIPYEQYFHLLIIVHSCCALSLLVWPHSTGRIIPCLPSKYSDWLVCLWSPVPFSC